MTYVAPGLSALGEIDGVMAGQDRSRLVGPLIRGRHGNQHAAAPYPLAVVMDMLFWDAQIG